MGKKLKVDPVVELAKTIVKAKFMDLVKDWDDGDPLWTGMLHVTFRDGTVKHYDCDWIRAGHKYDVKNKDWEAVAEYIIHHFGA